MLTPPPGTSVRPVFVALITGLLPLAAAAQSATAVDVPYVLELRGREVSDPELSRAKLRVSVDRADGCTLRVTVRSTNGEAPADHRLTLVGSKSTELRPASQSGGVTCWRQSEVKLNEASLHIAILDGSAPVTVDTAPIAASPTTAARLDSPDADALAKSDPDHPSIKVTWMDTEWLLIDEFPAASLKATPGNYSTRRLSAIDAVISHSDSTCLIESTITSTGPWSPAFAIVMPQGDTLGFNRGCGEMRDADLVRGKFIVFAYRKDDPQPAIPKWAPVVAWLTWGLLVFGSAVVIRRRMAIPSPAARQATPPTEADSAWLSALLPAVRLRRNAVFPLPFRKSNEALILTSTALMQVRLRRRAAIEPLFDATAVEDPNAIKGAALRRRIPLRAIERVEFDRPNFNNTVTFRIVAEGKPLPLSLKAHDVPNLVRAFELLVPGRIVVDAPLRWPLGTVGNTLLVTLSAGLPAILIVPPQYRMLALFVSLLSLLMAAASAFAMIPRPKWHGATKKKADVDLSARRPLRSGVGAIALRLMALVGGGYLFFKDPGFFHLEDGDTNRKVLKLAVFLLVGTLLRIANSLAQRDPAKTLSAGNARPILYLRSFLDDRETTLNPGTAAAASLGLEPPLHWIDQWQDTPLYPTLRAIIRLFFGFSPLRLLRLFFRTAQDSSEEQLGAFFKRHGTFVAIGKPGERFATAGAARTYVGNDQWQDVVKELLTTSEMVVLQPATTAGIWWEIERTREMAPPRRVLFCMVNYRGYQDAYENFRIRFAQSLPAGTVIPRAVACRREIVFFRFNDDWTPVELPTVQYFALRWPFKGRAVNLDKTLAPYLDAVPT